MATFMAIIDQIKLVRRRHALEFIGFVRRRHALVYIGLFAPQAWGRVGGFSAAGITVRKGNSAGTRNRSK